MAVVTLVMVIRLILIKGFGQGGVYLVFPGLAAVAYAVRRGMRKRYEKREEKNESGIREKK